jgi:hypothetical protein
MHQKNMGRFPLSIYGGKGAEEDTCKKIQLFV